MLERLGSAESGDSPSGWYKKSLTAMSAGMKAALLDFDMTPRTSGGTVTHTEERNAWRVLGGGTRQASWRPMAMGDG